MMEKLKTDTNQTFYEVVVEARGKLAEHYYFPAAVGYIATQVHAKLPEEYEVIRGVLTDRIDPPGSLNPELMVNAYPSHLKVEAHLPAA